MRIPTRKIRNWVNYEVKAGLFKIAEVTYRANAYNVNVIFDNEAGDRIMHNYNIDHKYGSFAWNKLVGAAVGKSDDGDIEIDELIGKFVLLDIEATKPEDHIHGTVFHNIKRTFPTSKTFGEDETTNEKGNK